MDNEDLKSQEYHEELQEYYKNRAILYDTLCKGLFQSRIEMSKQLLGLSVLAIGLLVGILGDPASLIKSWIWLGACFSFLACIMTVLIVFYINGQYIEGKIGKHHEEKEGLVNKINKNEKFLDFLKPISPFTFALGAVLTTILAGMKILDFPVNASVIAFVVLFVIIVCVKYYKC